jgi:hypothetical protein
MCCGLWLERDHGRPASELLRDPAFVERYVRDLALGLKAAIMLLNPARIVIGGGISKAGDRLFVPLRRSCRGRSPRGRARGLTWFPRRSATIACCMARWRWPLGALHEAASLLSDYRRRCSG